MRKYKKKKKGKKESSDVLDTKVKQIPSFQ